MVSYFYRGYLLTLNQSCQPTRLDGGLCRGFVPAVPYVSRSMLTPYRVSLSSSRDFVIFFLFSRLLAADEPVSAGDCATEEHPSHSYNVADWGG